MRSTKHTASRYLFFFFFKQKTAYEMRISDWSSDVCSSDLADQAEVIAQAAGEIADIGIRQLGGLADEGGEGRRPCFDLRHVADAHAAALGERRRVARTCAV